MKSTLSLSSYTFTLKLLKDGRLPAFKGSFWHGIIGSRLKELHCVAPDTNCKECQWNNRCGYIKIFEPSAQTTDHQPSQPKPKGFVIRGLGDWRKQYRAGNKITVDLTLIGDLQFDFQNMVSVFSNGLRVGQEAIPTELFQVVQHDLELGGHVSLVSNGILQRSPLRPFSIQNLWSLDSHANAKEVILHFQTPTRFKTNGRLNGKPTFAQIMSALIRKLNQLEIHYGSGEPAFDKEYTHFLIESARELEPDYDLKWVDWKRYSRRSEEVMILGGFTGTITLRGELGHFLPLLLVGEYLNIGKQASFGLGQFRVEVRA